MVMREELYQSVPETPKEATASPKWSVMLFIEVKLCRGDGPCGTGKERSSMS